MSLLSENVRRVYGFFDEVFDNHEHHENRNGTVRWQTRRVSRHMSGFTLPSG